MKHLSIIISCAVVTALAVAGVVHVVVPADHRSQYFMVKLLWAECIVLAAWSYIAVYWRAYPEDSVRSGAMVRIVPGLGVVTFLYVSASAIALVVFSMAGDSDAVNRAHLAAHIVMTALFAVAWLLLGLSRQRTGRASQAEVTNE